MVCVLELALQQPVVRLGRALFRQPIGAPIEGQLSKAIASAVLAFEEMKACESLASLREAGFLPMSVSDLPNAVANTRYVDDNAMASRILCSSCLHALTPSIYSQPIAFEPAAGEKFGLPGWMFGWTVSAVNSL